MDYSIFNLFEENNEVEETITDTETDITSTERETHNFAVLKAGILEMSAADKWETAKDEWQLTHIYQSGFSKTCLCGHNPIMEICVLHNETTGKTTEVGNQCVKRFLGLRSDLIFTGVKRVKENVTKSLNAEATQFFFDQNVLNDWEYEFQMNTINRRKMTPRQRDIRRKINEKVVEFVEKSGDMPS